MAQVRDYKIENNTLSIETDFSDQTLEDLIEVKSMAFQRKHNEDINSIEFFFSINLLRELTECLNYLHSLSPPVVHRELRPLTVLITDGRNNRFIKLCDIGLGQIADDKDYYSVSGSCNSGYNSYQSQSKRGRSSENFLDYRLRYQAPEVIRGNYYNHKADIYSLAMIAMDLFEFESYENWYLILICSRCYSKSFRNYQFSNYLD